MSPLQAMNVPILTNTQIQILKNMLDTQSEIGDVEMSLDLGISLTKIQINPIEKEFVIGNNRIRIPKSFDETKEICYAIMENCIFPMESYDEKTGFYYKLAPGTTKPYLIISSTRMHKEPFHKYLETQRFTGTILDAGTGLGYTAIIAAKTADKVITVEIDPNVLYYARFNPHSRALFENPKIEIVEGDITNVIKSFPDAHFDFLIQDGGTVKHSGDFFSQNQSHQLHRVLKLGGKLYFYLPNPQSNKGRDFASEQINRLKNAGFSLDLRDEGGSFCVFSKRKQTKKDH
jgi:predicted methyltransferase